mgnify:CR=1 FL=1
MRDGDIERKVRVFISSNINCEYKLIREALRLLLLETGMCEVYSFEEESGSSFPVIVSYLTKIDRSDLVVFLIDNKDKPREGTMKEYRRARELKKKCIFLFCNESEKELTELQREIMHSTSGEKYKEVALMSKMAEEAYRSVINDIVEIYHMYCSGRDLFYGVDLDIDTGASKEEIISIPGALIKNTIQGGGYLFAMIIDYSVYDYKLPDSPSKLEIQAGILFQLIVGKIKVDKADFAQFKSAILEVHSKGNLKKIVEYRLDALEQYLKGNIEKCESSLRRALQKAKESKNIPNWVINDIAIDIRNIAIMQIGSVEDDSGITFSQQIIDSSEEPIYFPVLDRVAASFYETLVGESMKDKDCSPFTVRLGEHYTALKSIADLCIVALIYGTITQIMILREKIGEYLQLLSINKPNHRTFVSAVEVLLLRGDKNKLDNYFDYYGGDMYSIDEADVYRWGEAINSLTIKQQRLKSEILLLSKFGYYLSNECFEELFGKVKANILTLIYERQPLGIAERSNIEEGVNAIINVKARISPKEMIILAKQIRRNKIVSCYDDVFKMLASIDPTMIQNDEIEDYIQWLIECCEDIEIKKHQNLVNAVQAIRFNSTTQGCAAGMEHMDEVIRREFTSFYEDIYEINLILFEEGNPTKVVESQLYKLKAINEELEYNSRCLKLKSNIFDFLEVVLEKYYWSVKESEIDKMCNTLMHTIRSEKQSFWAKCSAIKILIKIAIYSAEKQSVRNMICEVENDIQNISQGREIILLKGYTERLLACLLDVFKVVVNVPSNASVVRHVSFVYELEEAEKLLYLDCLREITHVLSVKKQKIKYLDGILQYVLGESKSRNKQTRFLALMCLLNFIELESDHSNLVLDIVSKAMDKEASDIKTALVIRVNNMDHKNPKVQYILEKAKSDNNFCVRSAVGY